MKLLWVGKGVERGEGGPAGDEIYDRRTIEALAAAGTTVTRASPVRVPRARELLNLARGIPHYRTRYDSAANRDLLRRASAGFDVAVASWEPLDALALTLPCPVIPVLHNVTSQSLRAMLPGSRIAGWLAGRAETWERRAYPSARFPAIAALSRADVALVEARAPGKPVLYCPPGMPPLRPLAPDAAFVPELLISGTYEWRPKLRDVTAFARDYAAAGAPLPVLAEGLPDEARGLLSPRPPPGQDDGRIRLGLVPDRFVAGHKLKATYYLSVNAVVLSYADLSPEFGGIDDQAFFVRRIADAGEVARHAREIAALPPEELRRRLDRFKRLCAERFSWAGSAATLLDAVRRIAPGLPRGGPADVSGPP